MGFADEYAGLIDFARLGAFVTNPLTAHPRAPSRGEHVCEIPGGLLIHTGLPNPGLAEAIRLYARKWARLPCPVIVHIAGATPDETAECAWRLEAVDNVAGIELGLRDGLGAEEASALIAAAESGGLPVLARLPLFEADRLSEIAAKAGAQAIVIGGPPRGSWRLETGDWMTGRLYGPAYFPLALHAVRGAASRVGLPLIGAGEIHTPDDVRAMLAAGATAVQVDAAIWRDPQVIERIAAGLLGF